MSDHGAIDNRYIGAAVVVWTGFGSTAWPAREESRVADVFGADEALGLMPHVRQWVDDFYETDAASTQPTPEAMARKASLDFKQRHPDAPDEAVEALSWCYTFDFK